MLLRIAKDTGQEVTRASAVADTTGAVDSHCKGALTCTIGKEREAVKRKPRRYSSDGFIVTDIAVRAIAPLVLDSG